jgi:cyanate permease
MTSSSEESVIIPTFVISTTNPDSKKSRKWLVLFVFSWVAGINQFCWLNLSPIIEDIQQRFHTSDALITLILLVFPLIYVIFSYHAGRMIDIRGYRFSICYGCVWTAMFSLLRLWPSYWPLLLGQIGIAVGQSYIINAICKLVMDWFPVEQTALATGFGTVGIFLCEVLSLAISAPIFQALGYIQAMAVFAGVTWIACTAFFLFGKRNNTRVSNELSPSSTPVSIGARQFWRKAASRNMILLTIGAFLGLGYFYAFTNWIVAILATQGLNSDQAGYVGGIF